MRIVTAVGSLLVAACSGAAPAQPSKAPPSGPGPGSVPAATPDGQVAPEPEPRPLPVATRPGQGFQAPVVETVRVTTTTEVRVMLERSETVAPWSGPVRYTAEPYTLTGRPNKGMVRERDVLGSRHALDLNGDGDTRDRFASGCDGTGFALGKSLRLDPVMGGAAALRYYAYAADDGQPRIGSLGDNGASAMLYLPCAQDGVVSLGWSPVPMEVREIPGPALMVLAFGNPALPPSLPDDGVSRLPARTGLADQRFDAEVFEPVVETPHWYAVAGAMVQIDPDAQTQEIRVFFDGDVEHVQIALNEGKAGVDRARSYVSTQTIGSR